MLRGKACLLSIKISRLIVCYGQVVSQSRLKGPGEDNFYFPCIITIIFCLNYGNATIQSMPLYLGRSLVMSRWCHNPDRGVQGITPVFHAFHVRKMHGKREKKTTFFALTTAMLRITPCLLTS